MDAATAKHVGARLLGEVEDGSLEELLGELRANLTNTSSHHRSPELPLPGLTTVASRYQKATQSAPPPLLSVSGRYLPLLYHLVSTLIAAPHSYTVVLVDVESRFDVTRLIHPSSNYSAAYSDLKHLYVYRPARGQEQAAIAAAEGFMLYGAHGSRDREWWGTVVVGGTGGDVNAGWKGWLRVEKEEVGGFAVGVSVDEALKDRARRQEVVDGAGWVARSQWGNYGWKDV
ncbi:Uu.00g104460.m01.CDS01 [Anthostomella pinea]|uniref:Uu.00g104460.m01.CDS01 n=1 Tax=Anthostomella pinea TaxID=933095 RepID=A0AAI8VES4_9PEZI|nr:Uu.00g104460.m01.CDS01 [Anthostomella pinea]